MKKPITILIPTYNRSTALAILLTSLCAQTNKNFDIVISDQSDKEDLFQNISLIAAIRVLNLHQHTISIYKHTRKRGLAEHRHFLLSKANTQFCLFLDDDIILEPWVIDTLFFTIKKEQCGLVGQAVIGLSFRNDIRVYEQTIEFWKSRIKPEKIIPYTKAWKRYVLHNGANLLHIQEKLQINKDNPTPYKIAWVGGCVLYNTKKLIQIGGFSFWKQLPKNHAGEDVLAQIRVMEKYGGCAILPSGVYHQELPTTVVDRKINAPEYLL